MMNVGIKLEVQLSMELEDELETFQQYIKSIETLFKKEKRSLDQDASNSSYNSSDDTLYQMYLEGLADEYCLKINRLEKVYPQIARSSFLMILWSIFEMHLRGFAGILKANLNIPINFSDLNGDLLTKAKLYFEKLGNINITALVEWEAVNNIQTFRNYLVHKTESTFQYQNLDKMVSFINTYPDLLSSDEDHRIEIKEAFCDFALNNIVSILKSILNQMSEKLMR